MSLEAGWQLLFTIPAFACVLLLYRSWKRYGGDEHYVPPVPGETLAQRLSEEVSEEEVSEEEVSEETVSPGDVAANMTIS